MIQGCLLALENWPKELLEFKCPHCGEVHSIYVSKEPPREVAGLHVWHYEQINEFLIRLSPSFDASKFCGYHSSNPWEVELTLER